MVLSYSCDDLHRPQASGLARILARHAGDREQQLDVTLNGVFDPRADDLDDHLAPIVQRCCMDLRYRRRGEGLAIERGKQLFHRFPSAFSMIRWARSPSKRRHLVLQLGQLKRDVIG